MSKIAALLTELSRNDDQQPCYNGIGIEESEIAYQRVLDKLYNDAIDDLLSISVDKDLIIKRLDEVQEYQSYFYYPTREEIQDRRDEEKQNDSESLRRETDYLEFMMKCIDLQRYYLDRFGLYFANAQPQKTDEQEITADNQQNTEKKDTEIEDAIIKGVEGLAMALGCGKTKAQEILNSKVLQEAKIAYRMGRGWRFDKEKLSSFVKDNPEIFRW
jgi:hypothetical protein